MTREELGEVVILNCDNKLLETPFDDVKNMPAELVSQLKKQLNNPHEHMGDRVSRIFLRILVQLIGGYRDAIKFTQGEKITWDRETFIESRPSHLRSFLRNMMELQIFQQFIEERLDMLNTGLGFSDEFELETLRYSENGKGSKHYKQFFRNVKDRVSETYHFLSLVTFCSVHLPTVHCPVQRLMIQFIVLVFIQSPMCHLL